MKIHGRTAILTLAAAILAGPLFALSPTQAGPAAVQPAPAGRPAPKAVAVEAIKEAGAFAQGDQVVHDFEIRNDGNAPLEITEVKAACGCTVASYDKTIAPGKLGKIHLAIDTTTLNGPIAKGVTVYTNDPAAPQLELTVRAKIEPYIAVKPGYARFTIVQRETMEGNVPQTVFAPDGSPMDIVSVESPYPFLAVSFHQAQEGERAPEGPAKQWRVDMKLSNEAPVGPLAGWVIVNTNHAKQKVVKISVSGFVRPVVAVTPPVGDFGDHVQFKQPVTAVLNVKSFATEPIHVIGVDPQGKGIEAKLKSLQDGREYQVQVTLSPQIGKGPFRGKLTIRTDSPKSPVIDVELKGTVI